jgi:hypothetical protein
LQYRTMMKFYCSENMTNQIGFVFAKRDGRGRKRQGANEKKTAETEDHENSLSRKLTYSMRV